MDYRDNRQRWTESHQVVHFYAGQWCTFTPALTAITLDTYSHVLPGLQKEAADRIDIALRDAFAAENRKT